MKERKKERKGKREKERERKRKKERYIEGEHIVTITLMSTLNTRPRVGATSCT
jgi:hypothetical protein